MVEGMQLKLPGITVPYEHKRFLEYETSDGRIQEVVRHNYRPPEEREWIPLGLAQPS